MIGLFDQDPEDDEAPDDGSERAVSPHPNFVTADGMIQIELALAREQQSWDAATAAGDRAALAAIGRELRYWVARRAMAQTVPPSSDKGRVNFGATVTVKDGHGHLQIWRIVGEDEAESTPGALSYVSPLAQAMTGRRAGETVRVDGADFAIVSVG